MGYTHYYYDLDCNQELARFAAEAIAHSKLRIRGENGTGAPITTSNHIAINGDADSDQAFEGFVVQDPAGRGQCCKTERYPYDEVVVAILLAAIRFKLPGSATISSDGHIDDWIKYGGVALYCRTYADLYDSWLPITPDFANTVHKQIGGNPERLIEEQQRVFGDEAKENANAAEEELISNLARDLTDAVDIFLKKKNVYIPTSVAEQAQEPDFNGDLEKGLFAHDYGELQKEFQRILKLHKD